MLILLMLLLLPSPLVATVARNLEQTPAEAAQELLVSQLTATEFPTRGHAVEWIGDLDGDGLAGELAIGLGVDNEWGEVQITWTNPVDWSVTKSVGIASGKGGIPAGLLGSSDCFGCGGLEFLGDFDGDGLATELAVSAHRHQLSRGAIFILWLHPTLGTASSFVLLNSGVRGMPTLADWDSFGFGIQLADDLDQNPNTTHLLVGVHGWDSADCLEAGGVFALEMDTDATSVNSYTVYDCDNGWAGLMPDGGYQGAGLAMLPGLSSESAQVFATGNVAQVIITWINTTLGVQSAVKLADGEHGVPAGLWTSNGGAGINLAVPGDLDGDGVDNELAVGAPTQGVVSILWLRQSDGYVVSAAQLGAGLRGLSSSLQQFFGDGLAVVPAEHTSGRLPELIVRRGNYFLRLFATPGEVTMNVSNASAIVDASAAGVPGGVVIGPAWQDPSSGWSAAVDADSGSNLACSLSEAQGLVCDIPASTSKLLTASYVATVSTGNQTVHYNVTRQLEYLTTSLVREDLHLNPNNAPNGMQLGAATSDRFGSGIARVGDADGDGCGFDHVVGSRGADLQGREDIGELFLFSMGCKQGSTPTLLYHVQGTEFPSQFLPALSTMGDAVEWLATVDTPTGRRTNLVVGLPGADSKRGRVLLLGLTLSGSTKAWTTTVLNNLVDGQGLPIDTLPPGAADFGRAMTVHRGGGSLNATVFIGAPGQFDATGPGAVMAIKVHAHTGEVLSQPMWLENGIPASDLIGGGRFGLALDIIHIDDGTDGDDWHLVSAAPDASTLFVLTIDEVQLTVASWSKIAPGRGGLRSDFAAPNALFGDSLAWMADMDGDGRAMELAVGLPDAKAVAILWLHQPGGRGTAVRAKSSLALAYTDPLLAGSNPFFRADLAAMGSWQGGYSATDLFVGAPSGSSVGVVYRVRFAAVGEQGSLPPWGAATPTISAVSFEGSTLSSLSPAAVTFSGAALYQWDTLWRWDSAWLLPPTVAVTGHAEAACSNLTVSADGSSLSCSLPPCLYESRNISVSLGAEELIARTIPYAWHGNLTAVVGTGLVPQAGNVPLTISGMDLPVLGLFTQEELTAAGTHLKIGANGRCDASELVFSAAGDSVTCTRMPAGIGGPHRVSLVLSPGMESDSAAFVTFTPPRVTGISPAIVRLNRFAMEAFSISGFELGLEPGSLERVSIGGNECLNASWVSSTEVKCLAVPMNFSNHDVSLQVAGLASTGGQGLLQYDDPPRVIAVDLLQLQTAGGEALRAFGSGFDLHADIISDVLVGAQPCLNWTLASSSIIDCVTPSGTGAGLSVWLQTSTGYLTPSILPVAYKAPTLTSSSPGAAYASSEVLYNFTLTGTSFGADDHGQIEALTVAGRNCSWIEHVSDTQITCHGVTAPWDENDKSVAVVISGQEAAAVVIEFQDSPTVTGVQPPVIPTAGERITIMGSGFGAESQDVEAVLVGGAPCADVVVVSSTELTCSAPTNVGGSIDVQVIVRLNGASAPQALLSYNAPVVLSVTARADPAGTPLERLYAGTTGLSFRAEVADCGTKAAEVTMQVVSGTGGWSQACADLTRVDAGTDGVDEISALVCHGVSLATFPATFNGFLGVQLHVAGQSGLLDAADMLPVIGRPVVTQVIPAVDLPTAGVGNATSATVQVQGENLGHSQSDVEGVTIGGQPSPFVRWESAVLLRIAVPPGVGNDLAVRVTTRGGLSSDGRTTISYMPASVATIDPPYSLTGSGTASFVITGTDFGNRADDLESVTVGGQGCGEIAWQSPTQVHCLNTSRASWSDRSVTLVVGGQQGIRNAHFEAVGAPALELVSPLVADIGEELLILGQHFGYKASDVVSVTVGSWRCDDLVHRSATALSCRMPSPDAQTLEQFKSNPLLLRNVPVVVQTAGGQQSQPANVSYSGSGNPLETAPMDVLGWRPVGRDDSFVARWTFPEDEALEGIDDVDAFELELSQVGAAGAEPQVVAPTVESLVSSSRMTLAQNSTRVFQYDDFVFTTKPVMLRIRAVNPTGNGPWSEWAGPLTSNCDTGDFLQTHANVSDWQCGPCPSGAFCGGAVAENVTATAGHWRVPWSQSGLGFSRCPRRESCSGYGSSSSSSNETATRVANATMRLLGVTTATTQTPRPSKEVVLFRLRPPSATPQSQWGDPHSMEGCAQGYTGTLCTSCEPGYTRWGNFGCRKCKPAAIVGLAMVGLALLVFVIVAYLIVSAVRSGAEKTPVGTAAIKVTFSHIQTVSIAASFNLQWPDSVLSLFAGMSTATSVSSEVLSLDCALPSASAESAASSSDSRFFDKASIVLAMPIVMLAVAALFWTMGSLCRRRKPPGLPQAVGGSPLMAPSASTSSLPSRIKGGAAIQRQSPLHPEGRLGLLGASVGAAHNRPPAEGKQMSLQRKLKRQLSMSSKALGIRLSVWDKFLTSAVVMMFLVHMSVTQTSLQLLTCRNVGADADTTGVIDGGRVAVADRGLQHATRSSCDADHTHRRLVQDLEVCCYDPKALKYMYGLGVPGLLVYAFGIPIAGALLLWWRQGSLQTHHTKTTLGFLYAGFKEDAYYWESVVMLRKVMVATIAVALEPMGVSLQTYTALALIALLMVLHARVWPYSSGVLNRLELGALVAAFLTFECGLFLTDPSSSIFARVTATMTIFMANLGFLLAAVAIILWDKLGLGAAKKRRNVGDGRTTAPALPGTTPNPKPIG